ncbi:MAG TPA: glycosyltransferase family 39 protein [Patescibacteria group bacterium]|nr:glycosyltransferase family 39 protein [Patescibacteria group bacterium]
MTKNKTNFFALIVITFLGLILRFWQLDKFPVSLNWDEVSHGYNAYSILTTGKDEWGTAFPLIFRAFGDFKLPIYIYLTVIPVFLFGLNAFAVRFVSALAGGIAIPLIYLLAKQLFPDRKNLGLIAAALLAFSPWHLFISRPALEANLALTLTIAGALFLLLGLKKTVYYLPAAVFFALAPHTYNTARVFVPLLLLTFFFIYRKALKIDLVATLSLLLVIFSFAIVINQVAVGSGTARYQKIAILSESAVFQIGENRSHSRLPALLARLVYNRPVYFATTYIKNYFSYFSPAFFNQSHGVQTQFAIPNQNLFTVPVLFLALIGFLLTVKNNQPGHNRFLIAWLLLSPVAAATTADPPQALRPNTMIPAIIVLSAFGLVYVAKWLKTPFIVLFTALFIFLFAGYLNLYFGDYQKTYSAAWQFGNREAIEVITKNIDHYDRIIMSKRYGEPHIFYAFYSRLDPKLLMPGPDNIRFMKSDWYWTDKIGKVYFINDWQIGTGVVTSLPLESGGTISTNNSLLITSPDHLPKNITLIDKIDFLNGDPAFVIAKFN